MAADDDTSTLATYGALIATYGTVVAGSMVALARRDRLPDRVGAGDLALVAAASHVLSRRLAKDKVTRVVRAPFTEHPEPGAPGELNEEVIADRGPRKVVGELLGCPFCLSQWTSTAFVLGLAVAPRPTRLVASMLAATGASDYLNYGRTILQQKAEG